MENLTEQQRQALDELGCLGCACSLTDLLYWESEGFGDSTITELIKRLLEEIESHRKEA